MSVEKIAIVMDSTAYLPDELTKELNIRTVYLNIVIDGNSYKEVIDMPLDKYYDYLKDPNNSFVNSSGKYAVESITIAIFSTLIPTILQ